MTSSFCRSAVAVGSLLLLVGCTSGPVAPDLNNSRLYSNPQEGFRILLPEGWVQVSSSALPAGPLRGEIFLVRYNLTTPEQGATFQIVCMDDREGLNLESHHAEPSFRVTDWKIKERAQQVTIDGVPAEQMSYSATIDGRPTTKTVTSFRRNGRVYSLIGVFWTSDENAKQQVQRATNDIIWSN